MLTAIVLAAGASTRMGHPKALLTYRGETFLEGILRASFAAGLENRVVVLGHGADKVMQQVDLSDVKVVRSRQLEAGPIGSIRAGIQAVLNHPVEGILVWPVDRPHVSIATVGALADAFRSSNLPVVVPVHEGKRGHPVIFGRAVFEELLQAPDDLGARAVVRADRARVHEVPVNDRSVLEDLNTPDDYRDLLRMEDSGRGDWEPSAGA
jgi:molybdenum cofactor cytidylyltransferase